MLLLKLLNNLYEQLVKSENAPNRKIDKLALLTCYLSHEIYEFIEGCKSYESAKVVLNRNFLKRKSTTYTRQ